MLRQLESILDYKVEGIKENIGEVADFYFDDETWDVRYIVVDTGNWLVEKKVILHPEAFEEPDWRSEQLPTKLTKKEIEESPGIDADKPVSREKEQDLFKYFRWAPYWNATHAAGIYSAASVPPVMEAAEKKEENKEHLGKTETNLRSIEELNNYTVHAENEDVGKVRDFIFNDQTWKIEYVVVDIGSLFKDREILIPSRFIEKIEWNQATVKVSLSKETIEKVPPYDENEVITNEYEKKLEQVFEQTKE